MLHLGDITKISGYDAPVVDCIIGGSPCQDLSMAGKRAGLDGERSGLYIEQVRIVKEMRLQDERNGRAGVDVRPRYMVWENVPGAFSSNKGEDFRIVLEELAKVKDKDAVIPMPEKWTNSGCIMGDGWSIAWRVLDAQFWGVPQRRRRIALVADFGGQSAPEILFVAKSVSGNIEPSEPKRKATSSDAERSIGADYIIGVDGYNGELTGHAAATLGVNCGLSTGRNGVLYSVDQGGGKSACNVLEEKTATLTCTHGGEPVVCYCPPTASKGCLSPWDCQSKQIFSTQGVAPTLYAGENSGQNQISVLIPLGKKRYIVRRLTPLECERLQGYPDGWTDIGEWTDSNGKKRQTSDAARYKALGNSIALPPWKWVLKRLCACYERDATMASLFDGIGGFPYLWEQLNGKGTCLWASEIEEFPIAVTKARIE